MNNQSKKVVKRNKITTTSVRRQPTRRLVGVNLQPRRRRVAPMVEVIRQIFVRLFSDPVVALLFCVSLFMTYEYVRGNANSLIFVFGKLNDITALKPFSGFLLALQEIFVGLLWFMVYFVAIGGDRKIIFLVTGLVATVVLDLSPVICFVLATIQYLFMSTNSVRLRFILAAFTFLIFFVAYHNESVSFGRVTIVGNGTSSGDGVPRRHGRSLDDLDVEEFIALARDLAQDRVKGRFAGGRTIYDFRKGVETPASPVSSAPPSEGADE